MSGIAEVFAFVCRKLAGWICPKPDVTEAMFRRAVGRAPVDDDLERCNCDRAGNIGHFSCGWDRRRGMPNFIPGASK